MGDRGNRAGQFAQQHDINVSPDGKFVYTVELSNHRVQKFTSNGSFVTKWGYENTGGEGASRQPHQLAIDSSGRVYLTDRDNSKILVFDSDGKFLTRWGSKGTDTDQFIKPTRSGILQKRYFHYQVGFSRSRKWQVFRQHTWYSR